MAKIFLNSGHCRGVDSGAINRKLGVEEAETTWEFGKKLRDELALAGYEVLMVQDDSLAKICKEANEWEADLFISIHCNAFNEQARGTETYCYSINSKAGEIAESIQDCLYNAILEYDDTALDRGVKENKSFYVLKNTDMPAVLVELAFIDNAQDAQILLNWQDEMAKAITDGIVETEHLL